MPRITAFAVGSFTDDRPVLVITEQGGKLERTPTVSHDGQVGETMVKIDETGAANILNTTKFKGIPHELFRRKAIYASKEEQKRWFINNQDLPTFTIDKLTFSASDSSDEATCGFAVTVPRYSSKAGKRLFIPLNKINALGIQLPKDKQRLHPLEISKNIIQEDEIIFHLPKEYSIESLPSPTEIKTEFGTYITTLVATDDATVTYTRSLTTFKQIIAADKYEQVRLFFKNISKADNAKMVLVRE